MYNGGISNFLFPFGGTLQGWTLFYVKSRVWSKRDGRVPLPCSTPGTTCGTLSLPGVDPEHHQMWERKERKKEARERRREGRREIQGRKGLYCWTERKERREKRNPPQGLYCRTVSPAFNCRFICVSLKKLWARTNYGGEARVQYRVLGTYFAHNQPWFNLYYHRCMVPYLLPEVILEHCQV